MITTQSLTSENNVKSYKNSIANKLTDDDLRFHNWYRFVLSFPPHLVREYIQKFELKPGDTVLDPFCGTGTTILEAKFNGLAGIGIEANPMTFFASNVKTNFHINHNLLLKDADKIAKIAENKIKIYSEKELIKFSVEEQDLILTDSISPLPLHKTLILRNAIVDNKSIYQNNYLLALANSTVKYSSNLHFGPEVGVSRKKKDDSNVIEDWYNCIIQMVKDLETVNPEDYLQTQIYQGDSRELDKFLLPGSINAVFTSPPYPNEKDYSRTTRLESVLLGYIKNKEELRALKKTLLRSNTRNVYKGDDDDRYIGNNKKILRIADEIEQRRIELNKTSGFEKLYHKVTKLYFGGIARHLTNLKPFLSNNACLGYVVGDQASYLQIHIPTGQLIAEIAESLGYEVISIDLFRTRFSTTTKKDMNEEVVYLKWRN